MSRIETSNEEQKRILIAEDNDENRKLIQLYFTDTQYEVEAAKNGEMAVEMFKSSKYSLVLMDVIMPVVDGYAATRQIREWEKEHDALPTPIIALTAHAFEEDVQKSLDAGCDGHIVKPVKRNSLLETIAKYI